MKEQGDNELTKALRALDPARGDDLDAWAESGAGRRVHARILELQEAERRAAPTGRRVLRPALVVAATAVVVAAVIVSVVLATRDSSDRMVESTVTIAAQTTATSAVAPADGVDRLVALQGIVWAAEAVRGNTALELPDSPMEDPATYAGRAEELGITLLPEREALLAPGSVNRGTYALWIWRAFAELLPEVRDVHFADLDVLPEDIRQAVLEVARAGIVDGRTTTRFAAAEPLTAQEESEARARLWTALGLMR